MDMTNLTDQEKALVKAVRVAAMQEYDTLIAKVRRGHEIDIENLKGVISVKDSEIKARDTEIAKLGDISQLRANLYAFSDTFHIAAKRIAETEDPAEEAKTLKSLADQLLQAVGLPPRKEDE